MKNLLKLAAVFIICISFAVHAQPTLESLMSEVSQVSAGSELEILNRLSADGNLDQSVPKRTISTSYGTKTIFVFNLGSGHESAFDEIVSYYQNGEGFTLEASDENNGIKGVELNKGSTGLFFIKKNEILVEYKIEEAFQLTEPGGEPEGDTSMLLIVVVVVIVIVGFACFRFFRKGSKRSSKSKGPGLFSKNRKPC